MLRLSKLADYATVVMVYFSNHRDVFYTAKHITQMTHLTLPTVSKLLKILTAAELLVSHRGSKGGYSLERDPKKISVEDVIAAVEGRPALTECSLESSSCSIQDTCTLQGNWSLINEAVSKALSGVSLEALATPSDNLVSLNWPRREIASGSREIILEERS